jgi:hypothetical protein
MPSLHQRLIDFAMFRLSTPIAEQQLIDELHLEILFNDQLVGGGIKEQSVGPSPQDRSLGTDHGTLDPVRTRYLELHRTGGSLPSARRGYAED